MDFPNIIYGVEAEAFNSYTREGPPVGHKMVIEDGRTFRFAEAAGSALVVGSLNQGAVPSANFETEAIGTHAAGVTVLTEVGASTGNGAIGLFKYGWIWTDDTTQLPLMRIKDNTLISEAADTGTITLFNPTPAAITVNSTVSYVKNVWRDVIIHDSPNTAVLTGVCKLALAANEYGWLQTAGPCSVLYDSSGTAVAGIGDPVGVDQLVDGAVSGLADQQVDTDEIIGVSLGIVEADGEQTTIFLKLE